MRVGGEVVYIALGANLGDREAAFAHALAALQAETDLLLLGVSPVYETPPIGPPGQDPYLNAIVEMRSWLAPLDLLRALQGIESALGRDRSADAVRWGPRVMDLDVVFYGERVIDHEELTVPHPRAHERAFVMVPLAELAPGFRHPVLGTRISEIAVDCPDSESIRRGPQPPDWPAKTPMS